MNETILLVDNDLCELKAELDPDIPGIPVVHAQMKSWGKSEFHLFEFVWAQFRSALGQMGYTAVCAIVSENDDKLQRFSQRMGMVEQFRANGHILMVQEV